MTKETPEFITRLKEEFDSISAYNEFGRTYNKSLYANRHNVSTNGYSMRALNIVNAFKRGKPITSVESGDRDNSKFADALDEAISFIREWGESHINKEFNKWILEQKYLFPSVVIVSEKKVGHIVYL